MDLYSYIENGIIVRPVAADYMNLELEELNDNELYGDVYEPSEKEEHTIVEINMIYKKSDIDKLRIFLEGKYVFEEGEILAAFDMIDGDREYMVRMAYNYIKSLDDFDITTSFISNSSLISYIILRIETTGTIHCRRVSILFILSISGL